MQLILSSPHPLDFNMLVIFSLKNVKQGHKLICLLDHAYEVLLANVKMERQRQPEKLLIWGRSGTQFVAMVTELLCSYCGAHLVESYSQKSNISNTNWLSHHLANLRISLERKEIFENSKQHFSSHSVNLFMIKNGLDKKYVIFVTVPL